ncbi:Major facilitator superfamily (MFS_1) transporter [Burkholderia lata]|uniref:Major facilitator superfamily (MFS_1) transporter n=2 Tax=Burkholderia lata (strain ATCC 17760 / DSM 23089 / LMG 22485 / NCIMB 9086 / R18194 / 383) TaxID=482957 RepID=Q397T1_BURL3|nr:Major facilitator superfamily (MFS_1) transporter [Burkholderia lata]
MMPQDRLLTQRQERIEVAKLLFAQGAAVFSFRAFQLLFAWLVLRDAGSATYLASVIAVSWIVNLVAFPLGGVLIDRYGGVRGIRFSVTTSFAALLFFMLGEVSGEFNPVVAAAVLILMSALDGVMSIAPNAIIPTFVQGRDLNRYLGYAASVNSMQVIVGAIIGGASMAVIGVKGAILTIAILFAASVCAVWSLSSRNRIRDQKASARGVFKETFLGFHALFKIDPEKWLCVSSVVINFVLTPFLSIVIPAFIKSMLHAPVSYLAASEILFGIGMLIGAFIAPRLIEAGVSRLRIILLGNLMVGAGIVAVIFVNFDVLRGLIVATIGFALSLGNVTCGSLRGYAAPNDIRGRLEAAVFTCCVASIPLGSWVFGYFVSSGSIVYLGYAMTMAGIAIILAQAGLLISKNTVIVLTSPEKELSGLYSRMYPGAFKG